MKKTSKKTKKTTKLQGETIYVLRTCDKDLKSHNGFQWPASGLCVALDWSPAKECGHGLHGWAKGEGDSSLQKGVSDQKWLVVEVEKDQIVDLGGKVKFPRGVVIFVGARDEAIKIIKERHPEAACMYASHTAGDGGQATAGYSGKATAGFSGQATAGDGGQATAGNCGRATAGDYGQATTGKYGQATAGNCGRATAGDYGRATAGYKGQATAGDGGQATAGDSGQATAGDGGLLMLSWHDDKRTRIEIAYVGENGIEANTLYKLDSNHKFVKA